MVATHLPYGGRYTSHSVARKVKHSLFDLNFAANSFADTCASEV